MSSATVRTAAYLSSWRELILDDPKALFHAFAQAEKAADWVMQRHPQQLEVAAQLAADATPQLTAGLGHDGQALGQDVGHTVNAGIDPQRANQTWEGVRNGNDRESRDDRDMTQNPWGTPTPAVAGMEHQGGLGGFAGVAGFGMV